MSMKYLHEMHFMLDMPQPGNLQRAKTLASPAKKHPKPSVSFRPRHVQIEIRYCIAVYFGHASVQMFAEGRGAATSWVSRHVRPSADFHLHLHVLSEKQHTSNT